MAKTKQKFNPVDFVNDLIKDVQLPDDQREVLINTITGNPTLSERLGESVLRQSDYSRQLNDLQTQLTETTNYRAELEKWRQENEQVVLNAKAEAEAYKRRLQEEGVIPPNGVSPSPQGEVFTKKDWEKASMEMQNQGVNIMAKLAKIAVSHLNKYKEELDTDALVQEALKANLPLDVVYDRLKMPLDEKMREKEMERKLQEKFEEGRRAALSQSNFPTTTNSFQEGIHPLEYAEAAAKDNSMKVGWKAAAEAHVASLANKS